LALGPEPGTEPMSRRVRMIMLAIGTVSVAIVLVVGILGLPAFGQRWHPYRDHAMAAAFQHATANAVSSVNFDQRAFDTFGEETILVASVVGVAAILRPVRNERRRPLRVSGHVLDSTRLLTTAFFPATVLIGLDVVTHGAITPGGGFQGGVVVATGLHLLYVGGQYPVLDRLRPVSWHDRVEAGSLMLFVLVGLLGLVTVGSVFANVLPRGRLTELLSAGTVPVLNVAVGLAVTGGVVVLLAAFLDQALMITEEDPSSRGTSGQEQDEGAAT